MTVWKAFTAFAKVSVVATAPLTVESDMCLFQWGVYSWGEGEHFECDFTRQFVLQDRDGDYDHMEQVSLTLLLDPDDPELRALGSGDFWSGEDFDGWTRSVEQHQVFRTVNAKPRVGLRLEHSDV